MKLTTWLILCGLTSTVIAGVCMGKDATAEGWVQLDRRGFNAIWALRTTGDLFVSNGKTVHVSRDHGETWSRPVERQKRGRHYNSIAVDADWKGPRLAVFPIDSPVGWITLDGGETWRTFPKPKPPQVKKHDGWTLGAVDWSQEEPTRFFAKEHHSGNYWFSEDTGATWRRLEGFGGYFGIGFGPDGALLLGTLEEKRSRIPGKGAPGIYRSTDDGKSWELVFQCALDQKVAPQRFAETVYWPTLEGLAVSEGGGKSWELLPDSPEGVGWGPFFGRSRDEMVVVNAEGVHRTEDAGANWALIVPREELPKVVRDANFENLMPNFAWDPRQEILYATSMGVGLFRLELGPSGSSPAAEAKAGTAHLRSWDITEARNNDMRRSVEAHNWQGTTLHFPGDSARRVLPVETCIVYLRALRKAVGPVLPGPASIRSAASTAGESSRRNEERDDGQSN